MYASYVSYMYVIAAGIAHGSIFGGMREAELVTAVDAFRDERISVSTPNGFVCRVCPSLPAPLQSLYDWRRLLLHRQCACVVRTYL